MRKAGLLSAVAAVFVFVLAGQASAATFYVAPNGSGDGLTCTNPATPCAHVTSVITAAQTIDNDPGPHYVYVAAVDSEGQPAVYQENLNVSPGMHPAPFVIDGGWRGEGTDRATFEPAVEVGSAVTLINQGSELRNLVIDGRGGSLTRVVSTSPGPGEGGYRFENVEVRADGNTVGIFVAASEFVLENSWIQVDSGRALDLQGATSPRVTDSQIYAWNQEESIFFGGSTGIEFIRSQLITGPQSVHGIRVSTSAGQVLLDSSLIVGATNALTVVGGDVETRIVSSTIDAGTPLVEDASVHSINWENINNLEGEIIGSVLVEAPVLGDPVTVADVSCTATDVPHTEIAESDTKTVGCGTDVAGNSHHAPEELFMADTDVPAGYYLPRPGSPLIDTGVPVPGSSSVDVAGNPREQAGLSCAGEAIRDRGAVEAGCVAPKFSGLRLSKKKVKRGKKVKIKVATNIAVGIEARSGKAKARQPLGKWKPGTNTLTLKTKKLKARKTHKIKVTVTDAGGFKVTRSLKLKVK